MDIKNWIKQNPYFAAVIAAFIAYISYTYLSGPKTYEDCVMELAKEAKTIQTFNGGKRICRDMFP